MLAQAVTQLFPGAKFTIGPAIEDGFYYDFDLPGGRHVLARTTSLGIDARMREIIKADQPFVRSEVPVADALALFADQPYKCEIIERVTSGREPTAPTQPSSVAARRSASTATPTSFVDLCRGPHVPSTGRSGTSS